MNAFARFQLALNHDDPGVVNEGLDSFRDHILKEHGALTSFGYNGRCFYKDSLMTLHPPPVKEVKGLLLSFMKSSPQCEEMFILWSLTGSNESKELCASQMSCFAAILHCARSNESYCNILVHRILSEFSKTIHLQLNSGHMHLIHSTLGLCIEMGRSNSQNCRDLYQRIMYTSNNNIFVTMLQKGKIGTLEICGEERDNAQSEIHDILITDSRTMIIILIFIILESADQSTATEMTNFNSLYKKALNGIYKDSNEVIKLILESIIIVQIQPIYAGTRKLHLVDKKLISNVFDFYKNEDASVQAIAHYFNLRLSQDLTKVGSNNGFKSGSSTNAILYHFMHCLQAHKDLRHRKLQDVLISSLPSLLPKCLQTVSIEWEPKANFEYFCALSHLIYLTSNAPIDKQIKRSLKSSVVLSNDQSTVKVAIDDLLKHVVHPSLLRKDFAKLLLHPNCMLQRLGLLLLLSIFHRLKRFLGTFYRSHSFITYFNIAMGKVFPDFQIFLNLRSRFDKFISDDKSDQIYKEKITYLLTLVYEIVDLYIVLFPNLVVESKSDLLRLLEDGIIWKQKDNAIQALANLESRDITFIPLILKVLHSATDAGLSKWFGTHEEIVKTITNVIVNTDWIDKVKRSALAKLFLLTKCGIDKVASSAISLVSKVFQQVDMNSDEEQTRHECIIWRSSFSAENDSIILMDILLKIQKHWIISYCIRGNILHKLLSTRFANQVPLSSLAFCALTLCCSDFTEFFYVLPIYVQENLCSNTNEQLVVEKNFLSKFRRGFCSSFRGFMISCLTKLVMYSKEKVFVAASISGIVAFILKESKFQKDDEDNIFVEFVADLNDVASLVSTNDTISSDEINKKLNDIVCRGSRGFLNQEIYHLQNVVLKEKRRKTDVNDEIFRPTSYYDVYSFSIILLNLQIVQEKYSSLTNTTYMGKCLSEVWLSVADVGLKMTCSTAMRNQHLQWIRNVAEDFFLTLSINETDNFILLITPMLELMHRLSNLISPAGFIDKALVSELDARGKKRKNKKDIADLQDDNKDAGHSRGICVLISSYIIEYLSFNSFSDEMASAMHTDLVISAIPLSTDFGHFIRTILCAAANVYNRDFAIKKKCTKGIALWNSVADELIKPFDGAVIIDASVFSLGWIVQKIVGNNVLRGKFVDKFLKEDDSYALLQVPFSQPSSHMNIISCPTDYIWLSVLKSASVDSLTLAAHKYLFSDSSEQHVLMGVTVGIKCRPSPNLFEVSFYSCPLSILKVKPGMMSTRYEKSNFDICCSLCSSLTTIPDCNIFCSTHELVKYFSALSPQENSSTTLKSRSAIKNLISSFASIIPLKSLLEVAEAGGMLDSQLVTYLLHICKRSTDIEIFEYLNTSFLNIFIKVSITYISKSKEVHLYLKWVSLFNTTLVYFLDLISKSDAAFHDMRIMSLNNCIFDLLTVTSNEFDDVSREMIRDAMYSMRDELANKVNKWMRFNLKHGLQSESSLKLLSKFVYQVVYDSNNMALWSKQFDLELIGVYDPEMVVEMVISHSKFKACIQCEKGSLSNIHLLRFLLLLISIMANSNPRNTPKEVKDADTFLMNVLLGMYSCSMMESDRIILRILHAMESMNKIPPVCSLCPNSFFTTGFTSTATQSSWVISALSPPVVYATLMSYPFWRSAIPQPLPLEGALSVDKYKNKVDGMIKNIAEEWSKTRTGDVHCSTEMHDVDDVVDDCSELDSDSNDESMDLDIDLENERDGLNILKDEPNDDHATYLDANVDTGTKLYDPSFWLPALNYYIQMQELSVRQLANTGMISLVLASLGSDCPILRTYAISILQSIFEFLKKQTPDKDSAFRERPQLLMLINFVRNSIERDNDLAARNKGEKGSTSSSTICYRLPLCIAIFLGRCAMHLMQPGHELYGKINKYLLSRPFCDTKDIPLYDLLVTNGDSTVDNLERLIAIRMFTDSLVGREDHLNLCRKNAYNRLMLLFSLLSRDVKTGHAILDLIDKALSLRTSSRYLLERCNIIAWLQHMASPKRVIVDESKPVLPSELKSEIKEGGDDTLDVSHRDARVGVIITATPIRLVSRILSVMRRTIGANYLLSVEGIPSYLNTIISSIAFIIDEVINIDKINLSSHLPLEYFKQLVLCMWECSLTAPSFSDSKDEVDWGAERIFALVTVIQNCFKMSNADAKKSRDDLILSLYLLTAFKCHRYEKKNLGLSCNHDALICTRMLSKYLEYQFNAIETEKDSEVYVSFLLNKYHNKPNVSENQINSPFFQSVVHIFNQDNVHRADLDLSGVINTSWSLFLTFDTDNACLPISLCTHIALPVILLKGALNMMRSTCRNTPSIEDLKSYFPLSFVRWALLLGFTHLRSTAQTELLYPLEGGATEHYKSRFTGRILSCLDSGREISIYSQSYQKFQLLFRLSIMMIFLTLLHFDDLNGTYKPNRKKEILHVLMLAIHLLLRQNRMPDSSTAIPFLFGGTVADENFDGAAFWSHENNEVIVSCKTLCDELFDLISCVMTNHDKYVSSETEDICTSDIVNYGPDRILTLCSKLDKMFPLHKNQHDINMFTNTLFFEDSEGEEKRAIFTSTLFSDKTWRQSDKLCKEAITSSMKAGRVSCLTGSTINENFINIVK